MAEIDVKLQEVTDRSVRNEKRIEQLEEEQKVIHNLALSVKELASNQMHMKSDLSEIKADVKSLSAIPSQRWNNLINQGVAILIGMALSYLLTH